jgi:hypothetical protein
VYIQFYLENVKEFYKTECTENPCFKASGLVNFQEVTLSYPQQMHVVCEKKMYSNEFITSGKS